MRAEDIADRVRNSGMKIQNLHMSWCMPCFYLLGREWLLSLGFLRPQDALDDVIYVMDFWKRFQLSWHRNNGHLTARGSGLRAQVLPDRRLEAFSSDLFRCEAGDELHKAAHAFMATASQYGFLVSCESRISLANTGPYRIDEDHELLVRDFMDLSENGLPWLDGIASEVPCNNFTVTMLVKDCHIYLLDDWGSFEAEPEFTADKLAGVGLYTTDPLTDTFEPLGMESAEHLTSKFLELNDILKTAMNKLWERMAEWSRDQLFDAGALTYFTVVKDLAHVVGVFDPADWLEIDPRAERFRPLLNDEYANAVLGELVGSLSLPSQAISPFSMMQYSDRNTRTFTPLPLSVLSGEDYVATSGPIQPGGSTLDAKIDRYRTSRGVLGIDEYNQMASEHRPPLFDDRYRFLCETWVKYNADTPLAKELYCEEQRLSRSLGTDAA